MKIQLYMDYMSQPSRAVLSLFLIGKIPHSVIQTRVSLKQHQTKQFLQINPMGKIPAIYDPQNNFKLAQSHAILRYLYRKYPNNKDIGDWYCHGDYVRQAKIDQYLDFHHTNTRKCHFYIYNSLFATKFKVQRDPQFIESQAKKNVDTALKLITQNYLKQNQYLIGNNPTFADLSAFYEIQFLMLTDYDFTSWMAIRKWMKRMGRIKQVEQVNKVFIKVLPKINPNFKSQLL